jgi:hypothetical protein
MRKTDIVRVNVDGNQSEDSDDDAKIESDEKSDFPNDGTKSKTWNKQNFSMICC